MKLAIAFGSRGKSGALAHYEPARAVINLTKMKGAGSLAHEFGHALDDMLGQRVGLFGVNTMLSDNINNSSRILCDYEVVDAMKKVVTAMCKSKYTKEDLIEMYETQMKHSEYAIERILEKVESSIKSVDSSKETEEKLSKLRDSIMNCHKEDIMVLMEEQERITGAKDVVAEVRLKQNVFSKKNIMDNIEHIEITLNKYKDKLKPTNYYEWAKKLDQGRKRKYYSDMPEMFARAFESFIEDTLYDKGIISQYLVHSTRNNSVYANIKPYPEGEERKRINEAIRELLDTVYQKYKDDFGEMTNFSVYANSDKFVSYQDSIYVEKKPKKQRQTKQSEPKAQVKTPAQSTVVLTGELKELREAILEIGGNNTKRDNGKSDEEYMNYIKQLAGAGKQSLGFSSVGFQDFKASQITGMYNSKSCHSDGNIIRIDTNKPREKQMEGLIECLVYKMAIQKYGETGVAYMVAEGTAYAILKSMGMDVRTYCLSEKFEALAKDIGQSKSFLNICSRCFTEFRGILKAK